MVIGVSGYARSGKDTFFKLLKKTLKGKFKVQRIALADAIKNDLKPLLIKNFNINPFSCSDKEKEIIRPLMVTYGTHTARKLNENHWIEKIEDKVLSNYNKGIISVITDIRYTNEQNFIKDKFKDSLSVNIERFNYGPANKEEEINTPKLKKNSDYEILWKSFKKNDDEGLPFIESFVNEKIKM